MIDLENFKEELEDAKNKQILDEKPLFYKLSEALAVINYNTFFGMSL